MRCPKCQFDHELQTTECLKCGIVFSRYLAAQEAAAKNPPLAMPASPVHTAALPAPGRLTPSVTFPWNNADTADTDAVTDREGALKDLKYRALALPVALLLARLLTGTGFRLAAGMLAMVLHESGHAISAWLTGRWAVPMLWVTMHGDDRNWAIVALVTAAILFGGFVGWKTKHWGWVCAAAALLILQLNYLSFPAGPLITFGGDAGAMVLATILMLAFYAPRDSALYNSWGLRWGLLAIGALAFMEVYRLWSGPWENLPFGEIEGVNLSDPSLLTELYGWSVIQLVDRYLLLAKVCFAALAAVYIWGLVSSYLEMRSLGAFRWPLPPAPDRPSRR